MSYLARNANLATLAIQAWENRKNSKSSSQRTLKSNFKLAPGSEIALENWDSRSLTSEDEWLTTEQAAAYLKLSVGSLRNMTSNGHIPYHKLGKRNRYRLGDLRELLLSQKRGGF